MKTQIGIWIDKSKAQVISPEKIIKTIYSEFDPKPRIDPQKREFGRFGKQVISTENSDQNRFKQQELDFLKNVMNSCKNMEGLLIFGPAYMKNRLHKLIQNDHLLKNISIHIVTAQKMTDNQLVAFVKKHFKTNNVEV